MAVGTFEDSFFNYAKRWFDSINHGGAFELGDSAYSFFLIIEEKIRVHLKASNCDERSGVVDDLMKVLLLVYCMCGLK